MDDNRQKSLIAEYSEVCNNFRLLTDIRFKLLAFLPIASVAALAFKVNVFSIESFIFSLFGIAVTVGIITYNTRNDQLYNELVGRASSIERFLGLADGAFANRPQDWFEIDFYLFKWRVNHGNGIGLIYSASCMLWLFGVLTPFIEFTRNTYLLSGLPHLVINEPLFLVQVLALITSIFIVVIVNLMISVQRTNKKEYLRLCAKQAFELVLSLNFPADLKKTSNKDVRDFSDSYTKIVEACSNLSGFTTSKVKARLDFYSTLSSKDLVEFYLSDGTKDHVSAQLISLLTDLPPGWIYDCAKNRKGMRFEENENKFTRKLRRILSFSNMYKVDSTDGYS